MRDFFDRYTVIFYIAIVGLIWAAIYTELYMGYNLMAKPHTVVIKPKSLPVFDLDTLSENRPVSVTTEQPWDTEFKSSVVPTEEH